MPRIKWGISHAFRQLMLWGLLTVPKIEEKMKPLWIIIISIAAAGIVAGCGTYYFMNKDRSAKISEKNDSIAKLEKEIKGLKGETEEVTESSLDKSSDSSAASSTATESETSSTEETEDTAADATAGWQTYTNRDIGYVVKYPQGWILAETDKWEEGDRHIRYITISSWENSANRISMHWGLVRDNTLLYSTDRTGIGAGEIVEVTSTMPVLGASIKKTKLVNETKIKEYFYAPRTAPSGYTWESSISLYDQSDYNSIDLTNVSQIDMAEAILANITLME